VALPLASALLALAFPASGLECSAAWATQAVSEAINAYGGCGTARAAFYYRNLFPAGVPKARAEAVLAAADPDAWPGPAPAAASGEMTPISLELVRRAARHLGRQLLVAKEITASCGSQAGVAGGWNLEPNTKERVTGSLNLSDTRVKLITEAAVPDRHSCAYHCKADDLANTVLHEVSHIFVDYFAVVYGAKPDLGTFRETLSYSYPTHWNGDAPRAGVYKEGYCIETEGPAPAIQYQRLPKNTRGNAGDEETARRMAAAIPRQCPDVLKAILAF
jgi:hypothetical protein